MKVWKVINIHCEREDEELEEWLNKLEAEDKKIKKILRIGKFDYKIIYTEEDITDEARSEEEC